MNTQSSMTARAGAQLAARMRELKGARGDMYLAGYTPVSASAAKILIGFAGSRGLPELNQVTAFVDKLTRNTLRAHLDTVTQYTSGTKGALTVVASAPAQRLPVEAKDQMIATGSTIFMDTKIRANWEIKSGPGGVQYLECMRTENIPEIMNQAIASQGVLSNPISFGELAEATVACNKGDLVEFYADGGLHRGDVTKISGDDVGILADDRQWLVNRAAVTKILRLNPKASEEQMKYEEGIFASIWGKDFAKELVRNTATVKGIPGIPGFAGKAPNYGTAVK